MVAFALWAPGSILKPPLGREESLPSWMMPSWTMSSKCSLRVLMLAWVGEGKEAVKSFSLLPFIFLLVQESCQERRRLPFTPSVLRHPCPLSPADSYSTCLPCLSSHCLLDFFLKLLLWRENKIQTPGEAASWLPGAHRKLFSSMDKTLK